MKARPAWLRHTAWFALILASCDFATGPIVDLSVPTSGSGGDGPSDDGGIAGAGGKSGTGGAGMRGAGSGGAGTGGMGVTCVRNSFIECKGAAAIRCAANGRDRQSQDCGLPGCNPVHKRCNACTPGETFCADAATLATCGPDGLASSDETCDEGCNSAVSPALCNHCEPGISFCLDADTVRSCDGQGNAQQDTDCPNGCSATSSTTAQCNQCTPAEVLGCADSMHQSRCKADGGGPESVDCENGCSGDGVCNVCAPDTKTCSDADTLKTCNADGTGSTDMQCSFGCSAASCNDCQPSTTECQGNNLVVCSAAGKVASTSACTYGCDASATPDVCKPPTLVPSNLYDTTVTAPAPANPCEIVTTQELSVPASGTSTINTDGTCTRIKTQLGSLPDICVIVRSDITFDTGSTVTVIGSRALALVATGTLTLKGIVDGSASGVLGGPGSMISGTGLGGSATALPDDGENTPGNAGGGGGGFGMMGGAGGDDSSPGACSGNTAPCAAKGGFGMVQGAISLVPLYAGSNGGVNSAKSGSPRQGLAGGGGGSLQLVGCTAMTIANGAMFAANGGGGQGGRPPVSSTVPGAGAGGGSGGGVLLEAQTMSLGATIRLFANGGGGGGGASLITAGADGDPGPSARAPASGGVASTGGTGLSGAGGPGGYANVAGNPVAAGAGAAAGDSASAAGGGGGGVGRIRINNASGSISGTNLIASPVYTLGMISKCTASMIGPCLK